MISFKTQNIRRLSAFILAFTISFTSFQFPSFATNNAPDPLPPANTNSNLNNSAGGGSNTSNVGWGGDWGNDGGPIPYKENEAGNIKFYRQRAGLRISEAECYLIIEDLI